MEKIYQALFIVLVPALPCSALNAVEVPYGHKVVVESKKQIRGGEYSFNKVLDAKGKVYSIILDPKGNKISSNRVPKEKNPSLVESCVQY